MMTVRIRAIERAINPFKNKSPRITNPKVFTEIPHYSLSSDSDGGLNIHQKLRNIILDSLISIKGYKREGGSTW